MAALWWDGNPHPAFECHRLYVNTLVPLLSKKNVERHVIVGKHINERMYMFLHIGVI